MATITGSIISSLDQTSLIPSELPDALKAINASAVNEIQNIATLPDLNIADAITSLTTGSISSLDNITGLSQDQLASCVQFVTGGSIQGLNNSGLTTIEMNPIIQQISTTATESLDQVGLPADILSDAAIGIVDNINDSLPEIGITGADATTLLTDIQLAANAGLNNIDPALIVGTWDAAAISTASDIINNYDNGTYVDPFSAEFICLTPGDPGCTLLNCTGADINVCPEITGCEWNSTDSTCDLKLSEITCPVDTTGIFPNCICNIVGLTFESSTSTCSGTVPCGTITTENGCNNTGDNCSWSNSTCIATTDMCSTLDETSCTMSASCIWNGSTCIKEEADSCETFIDETSCNTNASCSWSGIQCLPN